ncbi:NUDIX domain-containing protein [Paenibacillus polymyxa]|nr:NUDIX domain-containing protein [Paenibacillus polymyxa]
MYLEPNAALIFAYYDAQLIFTHHRRRGWELPGGKREFGESILQTAIRELYEETGGEAERIEPIAQYVGYENDKVNFVKTVFIAMVAKIGKPINNNETDYIKLVYDPPTANEILENDEFSILLKDRVYELALNLCKDHRYSQIKKSERRGPYSAFKNK